MSRDFLQTLAERTLGSVSSLRPIIRSRFETPRERVDFELESEPELSFAARSRRVSDGPATTSHFDAPEAFSIPHGTEDGLISRPVPDQRAGQDSLISLHRYEAPMSGPVHNPQASHDSPNISADIKMAPAAQRGEVPFEQPLARDQRTDAVSKQEEEQKQLIPLQQSLVRQGVAARQSPQRGAAITRIETRAPTLLSSSLGESSIGIARTEAKSSAQPVIIRIGRIDVRAISTPAPSNTPARSPSALKARPSLADHLRVRDEERR